MNLDEACRRFAVPGLNQANLEGQERAFQTCLLFLGGIGKTKAQNRRTSIKIKHLVESPTGNFGIPSDTDCHSSYVYEGTLVLAALASGFTSKQLNSGLSVTFNMAERDLKIQTAAHAARLKKRKTES